MPCLVDNNAVVPTRRWTPCAATQVRPFGCLIRQVWAIKRIFGSSSIQVPGPPSKNKTRGAPGHGSNLNRIFLKSMRHRKSILKNMLGGLSFERSVVFVNTHFLINFYMYTISAFFFFSYRAHANPTKPNILPNKF